MQNKPWQIEMLGGLRVRQVGAAPSSISRLQTGALLGYLALDLHRCFTREELMALIWPEDLPKEARHKLRQSLYALRRLLEPSLANQVLLTTRTTVQVNLEFVTTDTLQFERYLHEAKQTGDLSERIRLLSEALCLYRGEFLPGFYQEEFLRERDRLAEVHRDALHRLALTYEQTGELNHAIETGRRVLALNPLMEEAHCDMMRLYAALGSPSAVMRQYQELTTILQREFGDSPSETTRLLMESLRQTAQSQVAASGNGIATGKLAAPTSAHSTPHTLSSPAETPLPTPPMRFRYVRPALVGSLLFCLLIAWQTFLHNTPAPRHVVASAPSPMSMIERRPESEPLPALSPSPTFSLGKGSKSASLPFRSTPRLSGENSSVLRPLRTETPPTTLHPSVNTESISHRPETITKLPVLWTASYAAHPGDKSSEAVAVTTDTEGRNIYVAGFVDTAAHDVDFLTLKYAPNGTLLWEERYNGPGNDVDRARALALDRQGNVYVVGESDNGQGNGPTRLPGADFVTIKYDTNGREVWVKRYNGPDDGEDVPVKLLVDDHGVTVLGRSWARGKAGKEGFDYVLVRYDHNGAEQWTLRYDGGEGDDEPYDMARDQEGNFYVTGQSRSLPVSGPERDILTIKASPKGKLLWTERQGANNGADDRACGLGTDHIGNVYVVGEGRGAPGTLDAARMGCLMVKYTPNGQIQWVRGTVEESDHIETVITAQVSITGVALITGLARNTQGGQVVRMVERGADGLRHWATDVGEVSGEDGPSAVAFGAQGAFLCGGLRRPGADITFFMLRYNAYKNQVWQQFLEAPMHRSRARAVATDYGSPVAVGQASDGKQSHLVVVKYQP